MGKTKVEIVCANCEIKFLKELSKINYNKKLGRKNCCSLSCAVKLKPKKSKNRTMIKLHCNSCEEDFIIEKRKYNLNQKRSINTYCSKICSNIAVSKNQTDEYTLFRRTFAKMSDHRENFLSLEELKEVWDAQNGICPYTGILLSLRTNQKSSKTETKRFNMGSVDRIDSSKPYIKGNIVFVSMLVNFMKNNLSVDDVVEFIDIMSKHVSKTNIEEIKENIKKLQNL